MLKSSIVSAKVYNTFLKTLLQTHWYVFFIVPPVIFFLVLSYFSNEISALISSVWPPTAGQGFVYYTDLVALVATEGLWISFLFFLATAITLHVPREMLLDFGALGRSVSSARFIAVVCLLFFGGVIVTAFLTLEGFPNSSNEYAYLFQAEIFGRGKLWERSHVLPDFFYFNNIVQQDGIILSRYPPGWPLVLSIAYRVGISPSLVNPVLAVVVLVAMYFFIRKVYGMSIAFWTVITLAVSSYFLFQAASYFSHVWSLLLTAIFVACLYGYQEKKNGLLLFFGGFSLGMLGLSRPYTALLVFVPFLVCLIYQYRWRVLFTLILLAFGVLPCAAYFLWYNYSITGDPFQTVALWGYPLQYPGFVKGHDVVKGFEHLLRWALMFCYWVSPGLLVLYIFFLWDKMRSASTRFLHPEDYICLSLAFGYFFYFEIGGNQYGPRFLFEGFIFLVPFVVSRVMQTGKKWMYALLFASVFIAAVKIPFISEREALIVDQRQDIFDLVEALEINHAVVLVASGTCPIRPMPPDDLTRNDIKFENDVIYARDLPDIRHQLMEFYGDRTFYRYSRRVDETSGELVRLDRR